MQLLSNGIWALGRKSIGSLDNEPIRNHLGTISSEDFYRDLSLYLEWVRDLLMGLRAS